MVSWIQKAEDHLKAAVDLSRRRKDPLPEHVCYLCRLAAEYYLKAFLLYNKESVFPSNDLLALLESCERYAPQLALHRELFALLNEHTEALLGPNKKVDCLQAKQTLYRLKRIRKIFIELFPPQFVNKR